MRADSLRENNNQVIFFMERIFWADHVKAFAIWLMVLCHFGMQNEYWETVIYSFHMPIFFSCQDILKKGGGIVIQC